MKNIQREGISGVNASLRIQVTAERNRQILIKNIRNIRNVNEWAERVGCTPCWLGKCIKQHYGMMAKEMLREVRYNRIVSVIRENPGYYADQVADLAAAYWNGKRLSDFLRRHNQTNFTKLRFQLKNK